MRISIIIPVLDEATQIGETLGRLAALAPGAERIVVDGGSTDGTPALASALARVIEAPRGRASQLNAGAAAARGDWLLFLHADTLLPPGFADAVAHAAAHGYRVGACRLRIPVRHPLLPVLAWGATWRTRCTGIALGDQAPFMARAFFQLRGGFPALPLMEDYAFFKALRRDHVPVFLAGSAVETAGRRWDRDGFWRTWLMMRRFYRAFDRGRDPRTLAAKYKDIR